MSEQSSIHWAAPTTLILSLVAGIAFALGHHFFYSSLSGAEVPNENYDVGIGSVSPQELNVVGGTALAFLCKACLVTAISTSYYQLFWTHVAHRENGNTLQVLDSTYSALSDVTVLGRVWMWWRHPLISIIAAVVWLLPLAAVVTPATLSVKLAPRVPAPSSLVTVPNVDFKSLNFVSDIPGTAVKLDDYGTNRYVYTYNGPSRATTNLVRKIAADGLLPQFTPPGQNSTWQTDFTGPSLRCNEPPQRYRSEIEDNILEMSSRSQPVERQDRTNTSSIRFVYRYLAWNADSDFENDRPLEPLPFTDSNGAWTLNGDKRGSDLSYPRTMQLNLAIMPNFRNARELQRNNSIQGDVRDTAFNNSTFLQCNIVNSTFHTQFEFVNGVQRIDTAVDVLSEDIVETAIKIDGPPQPGISAAAIGANRDCTPLHDSDPNTFDCSFDATVLQRLSYQALMQAFSSLFMGYLSGSDLLSATSIAQTVLWDHRTVKAVHTDARYSTSDDDYTLQEAVTDAQPSVYRGLYADASSSTDETLAEAMQSLFQTIVVAAMAEQIFQPNTSSAFAPPPANVTFNTYHPIYTYSVEKLWIAYGIAIVAVTLISALGLFVIFASGKSYSQKFSSVFLFAKGTTVDHEIQAVYKTGRDPLPQYLARAKTTSQVNGGRAQPFYFGKDEQVRSSPGYKLVSCAPL